VNADLMGAVILHGKSAGREFVRFEWVGRVELAMVTRAWKHSPSMKITRAQWRLKYVA
jgi:hypothetical protein